MAQLVASMSGVVLGGVVEVVGSNLARGKIFTASIGSVDSLYIYIYIVLKKSNRMHKFLFYMALLLTFWWHSFPRIGSLIVNKGF